MHAVGRNSQVSDYEEPSVSSQSGPAESDCFRLYETHFPRLLPESLLTDAGISVNSIHTLRSVLTLILQTVIIVLLAVLAHIAR